MKIGKPERLFQLEFGEDLKPTVVKDVTPEGFAGGGYSETGIRPLTALP